MGYLERPHVLNLRLDAILIIELFNIRRLDMASLIFRPVNVRFHVPKKGYVGLVHTVCVGKGQDSETD